MIGGAGQLFEKAGPRGFDLRRLICIGSRDGFAPPGRRIGTGWRRWRPARRMSRSTGSASRSSSGDLNRARVFGRFDVQRGYAVRHFRPGCAIAGELDPQRNPILFFDDLDGLDEAGGSSSVYAFKVETQTRVRDDDINVARPLLHD
ncbi:MAG: hypothetical protein AAFN79_09210 [Pseudomonadota bacterium]